MNIRAVSSINFGINIIDMHTHIGKHQKGVYTKNDLDVFVRNPLPNDDIVEKMIVSDMDSFKGENITEYAGNKAALNLLKNDKAYSLLAGCSPKNGNVQEIEKLFTEFPNDFVGLKFHPNDQKLAPAHPQYQPYFAFAQRNNLPCLFHTQVPFDSTQGGALFRLPDGSIDKNKLNPYCDPEIIYQTAKKYKDTPFIMAHLGSGWNESHDRAIDVLVESVRKGDANLYADISWVDIDSKPLADGHSPKDHIVKVIKKLKGIGDSDWNKGDQSFRVMFGTDAPISRFKGDSAIEKYTKFVEDIKAAIRSDKDLAKDSDKIIEDIFYNNAKKLFYPAKAADAVQSAAKAAEKSGGKTGKVVAGVILGALAVIGGGAYISRQKNNNEKNL